jgi:hypothetical protein
MVGSGTGSRVDAKAWAVGAASRSGGPAAEPLGAQPLLARAFFLRFASFRFRFTEGFS